MPEALAEGAPRLVRHPFPAPSQLPVGFSRSLGCLDTTG
jgi:hypothetical protein